MKSEVFVKMMRVYVENEGKAMLRFVSSNMLEFAVATLVFRFDVGLIHIIDEFMDSCKVEELKKVIADLYALHTHDDEVALFVSFIILTTFLNEIAHICLRSGVITDVSKMTH